VFGKERIGFDNKFGWDPRYTWNQDEDGLSPMMRRFVEEYPKDLNASRAAIRAGYSEKGASVRGNWLLSQEKVVKALRIEFEKMTRRNRIDQDKVIREVAKLAYSNIADFVKWSDSGITLTPSQYLSKSDTAVIKEVSETTGPKTSTVRIKLYDKPQALLMLCRYLGILDREDEGSKADPKKTADAVRAELGKMFSSIPINENGETLRVSPLSPEMKKFDTKLKQAEDKVKRR